VGVVVYADSLLEEESESRREEMSELVDRPPSSEYGHRVVPASQRRSAI
jgi:hypothetical protein